MTGMWGRLVRLCLVTAVMFTWACRAGPARAADASAGVKGDIALCQGAIAAVEQRSSLPRRLLSAISLIESGRPGPGGRQAAWPWTINVGGVGTFYETADAAIAAAQALQANGVRSFDVGCMQINLMHHPAAFASLQDAFDPALNAAYAARFLGQLHAEMGDWSKVVAAYHSRTAELAADYQRKVVRAWPDAAAYGVVMLAEAGAHPAANAPPALQTPEFAARLQQAAADHAALTRRIVGAGPSGGDLMSQRSRLRVPGTMRMAQAGEGRGVPTLRR